MKYRLSILLTLAIAFASTASAADAQATPPRAYKDASFTEFFRRTNGWVSGDGAFSVPLSDRRSLWLFGDSHIDDFDPATKTTPCLFQVRNAGLIQMTNDLTTARTLIGMPPGSRTWFKNSTNAGEWFWPVCGFQQDNAVYVYLAALEKTGVGGMWGFKARSHDFFAKIAFPELKQISYLPLPEFNGIGFGQGFVNAGEFTYAYGGKRNKTASDVYVAKFKSATPERDWTFWNGKQWTPDVKNAAVICHGTSTSVHICKVNDTFLLTTTAFSVACDQGKEIYIATTKSPTGPFLPLKSVYTVDDLYEGHYPFFYLAVAHPEFINAKHELLVTYSINGYEPCVRACVNGRAIPDHYRPKAIRVPLEEILNPNR
jgi:hypothetical protein